MSGNDESSPMSWKACCRGRHPAAPFQHAWDESEDPQRRLRIVIDQVASLTDLSIVRWREEMVA